MTGDQTPMADSVLLRVPLCSNLTRVAIRKSSASQRRAGAPRWWGARAALPRCGVAAERCGGGEGVAMSSHGSRMPQQLRHCDSRVVARRRCGSRVASGRRCGSRVAARRRCGSRVAPRRRCGSRVWWRCSCVASRQQRRGRAVLRRPIGEVADCGAEFLRMHLPVTLPAARKER